MSRRPYLLHVFPSFAIGGAQIRFCAIANHFQTAWRHAIMAMDGDTACRERLRPELIVDYLTLPIHKGDTLGNVLRYRRVLKELNPDVLVTYNWGSIEWAMANRFVGLRHIHIEDGFGPEERDRQLPRRVWTRRFVLGKAMTVMPSRTLWRIATQTWKLNGRRVRYLPNGIDLSRFTPVARANPAEPVVGTVAALRPEKNLARLLRAFALATSQRPARLVIVGDGPQRDALRSLAGTLGIADNVEFAGHMADPQPAYARFDLFALSSDTEQMPLSVLEAMASGLPVVSTAVGDVAEMLAASNRPQVTPLDDTLLAEAMRALLLDPQRRQLLGAANRARAETEYDQSLMFQRYADLLELPPGDSNRLAPAAGRSGSGRAASG